MKSQQFQKGCMNCLLMPLCNSYSYGCWHFIPHRFDHCLPLVWMEDTDLDWCQRKFQILPFFGQRFKRAGQILLPCTPHPYQWDVNYVFMKTSILKMLAGLYCGFADNQDRTIKILFLCLYLRVWRLPDQLNMHFEPHCANMKPCNAALITKLLFN